jgi:hypothetical protein
MRKRTRKTARTRIARATTRVSSNWNWNRTGTD